MVPITVTVKYVPRLKCMPQQPSFHFNSHLVLRPSVSSFNNKCRYPFSDLWFCAHTDPCGPGCQHCSGSLIRKHLTTRSSHPHFHVHILALSPFVSTHSTNSLETSQMSPSTITPARLLPSAGGAIDESHDSSESEDETLDVVIRAPLKTSAPNPSHRSSRPLKRPTQTPESAPSATKKCVQSQCLDFLPLQFDY